MSTDALNSAHPLYSEMLDDWQKMRHTFRGGSKIKKEGKTYLPPTTGHVKDGFPTPNTPGTIAYEAYKDRALFHEFVADAVEAALGILHLKPAVIELPRQLEYMLEDATTKGEGLQAFLRRINEQQLVTGRCGIMTDLPTAPSAEPRPYFALYHAEHIINWDDSEGDELRLGNLNLVVLDESGYQRKNVFTWEWIDRYRVLILGDPVESEGRGSGAVYQFGVFEGRGGGNLMFNQSLLRTPSVRGEAPKAIPFTFVNSKDIVPTPDDPPFLGLANIALAAYRAEADYRQNLFMQGQDTLVTIGLVDEDDKPLRTGSGARIDLPMGGDAKFIGVTSDGLAEQREAIENLKAEAGQKGGQLLDATSRARESGEALKVRVAARTATLKSIALTGALALQTQLRHAAEWVGADPLAVNVTPNLDFSDDEMQSRSLVEYMTAKTMGAPISNRSIHALMAKKGITELDYEEELAEIEAEEPLTSSTEEEEEPGNNNQQRGEPDDEQEDDDDDQGAGDDADT